MDIKPQINLSPTTTLDPSLVKLHSRLLFPLVGFAIGSLISLIILFLEEVIIEHNLIFEGTDLDHILLPVGCGILGSVIGFFYGKRTHQKKSTIQNLYISQQNLNLILDSMPQMILYIDTDLKIRYTNKTFEKWLGIVPGEICGKKLEDVAPKVIYNQIQLVLAENGHDEIINFESSVENGGKERHSITTMISHIASDQKLEGYFTVVTDVTKLRKRENKIKKQKEELDELNATKDKFFSIISHDLKNPFNSLLGFSELLHNDYGILDEATKKEFVGYIYEGVQNAYKLLNNLLAWSRAQSGKIEFNPSLVNLKDLVGENLYLLLQEADMKNIHLQADINDNFLVYTDPNR